MSEQGKAGDYAPEACGLTLHGTPPGGPGNRPTGFGRIAPEGEAYTGRVEQWRVSFIVRELRGTDQTPGPVVLFEVVEAATWFDARAAAQRRLRELGLRDGHPFELGRIV